MPTKKELEAFIRAQSAATGSLSNALHQVHDLLLSPDQHRHAVDVFPAGHLARALDQLCHCRGMIQEVQPEVHLFCASSQYFFSPSGATTRAASSSASPAVEADAVEFVDAVSLYVIPVPGNDHFYTLDEAVHGTEAARTADDVPSSFSSLQCAKKEAREVRKRRERDGVDDSSTLAARGDSPDADDSRDRKQAKTVDTIATALTGSAGASAAATTASGGLSLNLPHPSRHPELQTACIVTVLLPAASSASSSSGGGAEAGQRRSPFRVNDVIDFYGFQHFPDDQLAVDEDDDFLRFSAWNATELSRGLVSRLLCLAYSPVASVHLPCSVPTADLDGAASIAIVEQRTTALRYLCEHVTGGDELAAEYVLLHLCARVSAHSDALPVGDLPLLITSPQLCAAEWSKELRRVAPVAEVLLNSEALSVSPSQPLTPRYNNELNFLQSGVLQVANGSHVTVDCTALGTQDGSWYEGVFALVHKQLLLLDYPYQTLELPVDVSVLALHAAPDLSELHPVFNFALCLRWEPTVAAPASATRHSGEDDAAQTTSAAATAVRAYLTLVRRLPTRPAEVDDSVASQASAALLEMTRDIPGWNNRDPLLHNNSFSMATALMRAHAASCGRSGFTTEDIAEVRRLERARVARLSSHVEMEEK
ncbi:Mini-chromosome maintenance replisome factor [Lotmaria passim]